ncbi:YraN family protein [Thiomicrospira sp. ALE5]|uniref:YraN family protein n=1 Tax=Thiomicrospira sp. ALE5 TaxID=748650 RepID=UPI0008E61AB1|nr:YraN family protein [Thiomicrospira sp. ALE5]SFR60921.1 putative endonuclease [Thiomicrospira sp. ALE5]
MKTSAPPLAKTKRALGQEYEQLAADYLSQQGGQLLAKNVTYKGGELDLVFWLEDHLVFVEVRFRDEATHGHPLETITRTKQQRLLKAARVFLQHHPHLQNQPMRFDVVYFLGNEEPGWLKNAIVAW